MISGPKKVELTMESVLERCSAYEIYRYYFGDFELNQSTFNHLRGEKNSPSFIIGNKFGEISHHDFGNSEWRGDCFSLVQQKEKCNLDTALRIIDRDLNLGIVSGTPISHKRTETVQKPEVTKRNTLLQVITRKFTKEELAYWGKYEITEDELKREHIYAIKKAYLNKQALSLPDLRFGYLYEGWWKLYSPEADKKRKWISNVPLSYIDGKDNITNCETAWLTKSKKDKIILSKLFPNVASTQNESITCFSPENVEFIKNNSKKQIVFYDSDDPGVRACQEITKQFSFGYCNPPRRYLPEIKDFSDMVAKYGLKEVEKVLKEYNIL